MIASSRSLHPSCDRFSPVTAFGAVPSRFAPHRPETPVPLPGRLGREIRVLETETARVIGQIAELLLKSDLYFTPENRETLGGCPYDTADRLNRLESAARVRLGQWEMTAPHEARLRRLLGIIGNGQTAVAAANRAMRHLRLLDSGFLPPVPRALLRKPTDRLTRLLLGLAVAVEFDNEKAARDLVHDFVAAELVFRDAQRELAAHAVYLTPATSRLLRGTVWSLGVVLQSTARIAYCQSLPPERIAVRQGTTATRKAALSVLPSDTPPTTASATFTVPVFSSL